MEFKKALFSIRAKKTNFYISAFDHKIVFGPVSIEDRVYEELKCFEIDYCDYYKLYISFFQIVKFLAGETPKHFGSILENYKWLIDKQGEMEPKIIFYIADDNGDLHLNDFEKTFYIRFSLPEFNDLIYLLTEVCFISLNLNAKALNLFIKLSQMNLAEILSFQNKDNLQHQIKSFEPNGTDTNLIELHFITELAFYHLDVILCVHKLRAFFNPNKSLTFANINAMSECENDNPTPDIDPPLSDL